MSRQYFESLLADPQVVNSTALTATTIEALWPASQFTSIPAGTGLAGKMYRIEAFGIWSTGASGTLIITPSVGTATGGATLGVSATITVPVSITNIPWFLHALAVVRTKSDLGSSTVGTMMLGGVFISGGLTTNASPGANTVVPFGGTSAAFDTNAGAAGTTGAITIAKTLSVAGSVTTMAVAMQDLN